MQRRRSTLTVVVVLVASLAAGAAAAHSDEEGPARIEAKAFRLSTSQGYYQYRLNWKLRGERHNWYDTRYFRIEQATNNQTSWRTYADITDHVGYSFPMPLHYWYRIRAGGNLCFLDYCLLSVRSASFWIPAQRCGGGNPIIE